MSPYQADLIEVRVVIRRVVDISVTARSKRSGVRLDGWLTAPL